MNFSTFSPKLFSEACDSIGLGPRLEIENFQHVPAYPVYSQTREIANELIESARHFHPKLPEIYFDFIEDPEINAWAFRYRNKYFIALTAGAVVMLHFVLDRMLANPKILPEIGDPSKERDDVQPIPLDVIDPKRLYEMGIQPVVVQDANREMFSRHIGSQALMFLVGHEIAHVTLGHVDYLLSSANAPFVAELGWIGDPKALIERQAIEVDADYRSVFARCYSMYSAAEQNADKRFPWSINLISIQALQFHWAFAVNVLFRLFGDKRFAGTDLDSVSYPPLPIRQQIAMNQACGILIDKWGVEHKEKILNTIFGSVRVSEEAYQAIGASPSEGGFISTLEQSAKQHVDLIFEERRRLTAKLMQFAYETIGR